MSRINLDVTAFTDIRFKLLGKKLHRDENEILGRMSRVWSHCTEKQTYFITQEIFEAINPVDGFFQAALEVGLLKRIREKIYVSGTRKRIEWLGNLRKNSRKGGIAKALKSRSSSQSPALPEGNPEGRPEGKPDECPLSPAPAPAPVLKNIKENKRNTGDEPPVKIFQPLALVKEEGQEAIGGQDIQSCIPGIAIPKKSKFSDTTRDKMKKFIGAYVSAYKQKYQGTYPGGIQDKALVGKIGYWIEGMSEQRAVNLIEAYVQMSYKPFDENYHDVWQFFRHQNRVCYALDSGQDAGSTNWGEVFGRTSTYV